MSLGGRLATSKLIHPDKVAGHPDLRLLTGFVAYAVTILMLAEFIIKMTMGTRPALDNSLALVAYISHAAGRTLTVVLIDTLLMGCLIVFFACFRELIKRARADLGWVADIAFGAGLVFVAVTLVGDAMDAGTALDVVSGAANPSVLRALTEGHMLMFGSTGCVLTAIITAAFAYATFVSRVVPKWTGWIAYAVAILNVLALPTIFGGTNATSFISAGGLGVTLFAIFPFLVWVIAVGVETVRGRQQAVKVVK